jgi:integrase
MELTDTALALLEPIGTELALPEDLVDRAKDYAAQALAERSISAYQRWCARFEAWATRHGRQALPASASTIAAWLVDLADGTSSGRPLAKASCNQALAALVWAHRNAGYSVDRKAREISLVWAGISRTKVLTDTIRQAAPVLTADIADLLAHWNPAKNIDCRDAALILLGWAAALRRSELTGLDFECRGDGLGWVTIDARGVLITLARSKSSQQEAVQVVVPRADFEPACAALEAWVQRAQLQPGQPIFRAVNNRDQVATTRLTPHSVALICKRAIADIEQRRGKSREEAKAAASKYAGHSLRSGFCTSAAAVDVPALRIAEHVRHADISMTMRYVRTANKYNRSALKGIWGHRQEATPRSGE